MSSPFPTAKGIPWGWKGILFFLGLPWTCPHLTAGSGVIASGLIFFFSFLSLVVLNRRQKHLQLLRIRQHAAKKRQNQTPQEGSYRHKSSAVKRCAGDVLAPVSTPEINIFPITDITNCHFLHYNASPIILATLAFKITFKLPSWPSPVSSRAAVINQNEYGGAVETSLPLQRCIREMSPYISSIFCDLQNMVAIVLFWSLS